MLAAGALVWTAIFLLASMFCRLVVVALHFAKHPHWVSQVAQKLVAAFGLRPNRCMQYSLLSDWLYMKTGRQVTSNGKNKTHDCSITAQQKLCFTRAGVDPACTTSDGNRNVMMPAQSRWWEIRQASKKIQILPVVR